MRRDKQSNAILFPVDPAKQAIKEQRKAVSKHSEDIQFLADCINYQQGIIEQQKQLIETLKK